MTSAHVPHRFELELEVPGTPEQVWDAIATGAGISAWMLPTRLDPREGGSVEFEMGPGEASRGTVTGFQPPRRIAYEEDWATLVGHSGADVTPLVTEFLVEARSGGTCVVRVVTSAFGTGADWENEFWEDMEKGWAPMLDNLRVYLVRFPGQHATSMSAGVAFAIPREAAVAAVRGRLGVEAVGDPFSAVGATGRLERTLDHHFLLQLDGPVPGFLSFSSFPGDEGSGVHVQGYLFSDAAPAWVDQGQRAWQAWLEDVAAGVGSATAGAG
jgi:uncharacterized protein YndB with AHSA1/START domain